MGCAIVGSGDVVCDHEDYSKPHSPTKVAGVSGAVEIAVGSDHACARTIAGESPPSPIFDEHSVTVSDGSHA